MNDKTSTSRAPGRASHAVFDLGEIYTTRGALDACAPDHLLRCLTRHARGDWGCVCDEDRQSNDKALVAGGRILSSYPIDPTQPSKGYGANTLWIITEGDRSATTFLLPDEY